MITITSKFPPALNLINWSQFVQIFCVHLFLCAAISYANLLIWTLVKEKSNKSGNIYVMSCVLPVKSVIFTSLINDSYSCSIGRLKFKSFAFIGEMEWEIKKGGRESNINELILM